MYFLPLPIDMHGYPHIVYSISVFVVNIYPRTRFLANRKVLSLLNLLPSKSVSSALQFSMGNTCKHPPSLPLIRQDRITFHRLSSFHQLLHLQGGILMRSKYCQSPCPVWFLLITSVIDWRIVYSFVHGDPWEERAIVQDDQLLPVVNKKSTIGPNGIELRDFFLQRLEAVVSDASKSMWPTL